MRRAPATWLALAAAASAALALAPCFVAPAAPVARSLAPHGGRRGSGIPRGARGGGGADVSAWAASYVDKELERHPVVLFTEQGLAGAGYAEALVRETELRFESVDVGRLDLGAPPPGDSGASWGDLVRADLRQRSSGAELPLLFIGAKLVGSGAEEVGNVAASGELRSLAEAAGGTMVAAVKTNMSWTPAGRPDGRWLPPKNINNRRWYMDEANMEIDPSEHADPARIEYNIDSVSTGAGTRFQGRFSGAAKALLRQDTNLDMPDVNNRVHRYPPFSDVNLLTKNPDYGVTNYMKSADPERARNVSDEEAQRRGLPKNVISWVYWQGKKKLVEELERRRGRAATMHIVDLQNTREELFEELRKEQAFSPTGFGVAPGVVQALTGAQLEEERFADTDAPLLVAVIAKNSPPCLRLHGQLQAAAKRMQLGSARTVSVDALDFPQAVAAIGVRRYPTLIWLQARTGQELAREVSVIQANEIVERTANLLRRAQLPPGEEMDLLPAGREGRRASHDSGRPRVAKPFHGGATSRWSSNRMIRNGRGPPNR